MAVAAAWPEAAETLAPVQPVVSVAPVEVVVESVESPESTEATEATEATDSTEPADAADLDAAHAEDSEGPASVPPSRHVVYMARYRHTLKGIDRGKWETNVIAEADAPLVTVDAVVRGVQRRSGDVDDPTRMDGDEVREFMDARRPASVAPIATLPAV